MASGSEILEAHSKQLNWLAQEEDIVCACPHQPVSPHLLARQRFPRSSPLAPLCILCARSDAWLRECRTQAVNDDLEQLLEETRGILEKLAVSQSSPKRQHTSILFTRRRLARRTLP